jgi:cytochrome c oxidase assembly protein subunit 15
MNYPTWPLMGDDYIPDVIRDGDNWNTSNFLLYDKSGFAPALAQFVHRNLAYIITLTMLIFSIRWYRAVETDFQWISWALIGIIVVQVVLGILTLINSIGHIPVFYGAMHQGIGILFFTFLLYINQVSRSLRI